MSSINSLDKNFVCSKEPANLFLDEKIADTQNRVVQVAGEVFAGLAGLGLACCVFSPLSAVVFTGVVLISVSWLALGVFSIRAIQSDCKELGEIKQELPNLCQLAQDRGICLGKENIEDFYRKWKRDQQNKHLSSMTLQMRERLMRESSRP